MLALRSLITTEAQEFTGEDRKNGIALLGDDLEKLVVLVFFDRDTIRPYIEREKDDLERKEFLLMLEESGLPEKSLHAPIFIRGWSAQVLTITLDEYDDADYERDSNLFLEAEHENAPGLTMAAVQEGAGGFLVFILICTDLKEIEHFYFFFSSAEAFAFIQAADMLRAEEKVKCLQILSSTRLSDRGGEPATHIAGFAASFVRIAFVAALQRMEEETGSDPEDDDDDEGSQELLN